MKAGQAKTLIERIFKMDPKAKAVVSDSYSLAPGRKRHTMSLAGSTQSGHAARQAIDAPSPAVSSTPGRTTVVVAPLEAGSACAASPR